MEFREFSWAQQLYRQRLIYGPAAAATENSYPKYPAAALRELIRQSKHPHNLEPLLLTLWRPANADTRKRFAELAGELVLVERALSGDLICEDLQIVVGGRVENTPDGILYPDPTSQVRYEVWVRVEMLDTLIVMLREGLVRSLNPVMQAKLIGDLLDTASNRSRHPLIRGYALRAAHTATLVFNAVRGDALKAGAADDGVGAYVHAAVAALRLATAGPSGDLEPSKKEDVTASSDSGDSAANGVADGGPAAAATSAAGSTNPYAADPFERLKLLATAVEALYLAAAGPDVAASVTFPSGSAARRLADATRLPDVSTLVAADAAPLIARAVEAAAAALSDCTVAAAKAKEEAAKAKPAAPAKADTEEDDGPREMTDEDKIKAGELPYADNWQEYLKEGFADPAVATHAASVVAFGGALLQLLAAKQGAGGEEGAAWPSEAALARLTEVASEGLGGQGAADAATIVGATAGALRMGAGEGAQAVVALPAFSKAAAAAFARRCCSCGSREAAGAPLKRCGACARAFYCSEKCQKAAWSAGHKVACKQLQAGAAPAAAAAAVTAKTVAA